MDNANDTFKWPDSPPYPQQAWWLTSGLDLGLEADQVRFAAALVMLGGADSGNNTMAARTAGMTLSRTEAFRLARSVKIRKLIDAAEQIKDGKRKDLTEAEINARIDKGCMSPGDSAEKWIRLRDQRRAGSDVNIGKMVPPDDMLATILVCCDRNIYRREIWPVIWLEAVLSRDTWWSPLIPQMAPYLKQNYPQLWAGARDQLAKYRPEELARLEDGPVLSAEQIFEITARNMVELFVVLDSNSDPDNRKRAYDDLRRVGLLEAFGNA